MPCSLITFWLLVLGGMPKIAYKTDVFTLNSALGAQATGSSNATSRNRFVLDGSRAAFKMGHQRSHTAPWNQPPLSFQFQECQSMFSGASASGFAHTLVPGAEIELMESNFDEMWFDSGGGNDFEQYNIYSCSYYDLLNSNYHLLQKWP